MPTVSVLVPIYNVERYLEQCLRSLADQTYQDFEAILINDGSTDGSRAIIQRFLDADPRFTVIDKPNSGYGASMNRGMDAAQGRYLAILESDDFYADYALERLVAEAERTQADVVKADFWLYWSQPQERNERFGLIPEGLAGATQRPSCGDTRIFHAKPSIWSALYRLDFLRAHDIRFLETPGASYQDTSFSFKVFAFAERVTYLDACVVHYRQDNEASSVHDPRKAFLVCPEYAECQRVLDETPELKVRLQGVLELMKFDTYMWNWERLDGELADAFLQRVSEEFSADEAAGRIDHALFDPVKDSLLLAAMHDHERFRKFKAGKQGKGKFSTLRLYWGLGGPRLVSAVLGFGL